MASCAYCGNRLDKETATRDHFLPLSRGGSNKSGNIVPACVLCNTIKADRVFETLFDAIVWIRSRRLEKGYSTSDVAVKRSLVGIERPRSDCAGHDPFAQPRCFCIPCIDRRCAAERKNAPNGRKRRFRASLRG